MVHQSNSRLANQLVFIKQKQFTGKVKVQSAKGVEWSLYLCLGRLVWTDGGIHPNRSWKRLMDKYCPQVNGKNIQIIQDSQFEYGDYYALTVLLQRKLLQREQATEVIRARASEVFFDLLQHESQSTLKITPETASTSSFLTSGLQMSISLVNIEEVLVESEQAWLIWQEKGLGKWSPHLAPMMKQQEKLREEVSGIVFQNFLKLLDGQRTLIDLAARMNKDVRRLTSSLVPYLNKGLLELLMIDDIEPPNLKVQKSNSSQSRTSGNKPLIACIDDSPQICNIMEQIITKAGYRFVGIQQAIQAVPGLIAANPDLIFLDIGMPIVNGYEICSQIKRVSKLKHIPIIILTGNDGIVDRVRAKVVGANDFVAKPVEIEKIHEAIAQNLPSKGQADETQSQMTPNPV
ncbi:MAG: response regulator [Xenococcaceae cyanobacterium MO_167.B27]|nr:response regulator [Xenococcaceae cyanobacterium MO_167.B27]